MTRLEPRATLRRVGYALAAPALAVVVALGVSALALQLSGHAPFTVYKTMLQYGVCSRFSTGGGPAQPCTIDSLVSILNRATPLYLSALAVAVGFKMNLFNIGVDGQYRLATLCAAAAGGAVALPAPLEITMIVVVAMLVGALWAGIAGVLKVTRGVSEVISTIMLNFIATGIAAYLLSGYFKAPGTGNLLTTHPLPSSGHFPSLNPLLGKLGIGGASTERLYGFLLVAIVVGVLYHLIIQRTRFGFELRASGLNPFAAQASGVDARSMVVRTMLISGAVAGLVGLPILLGASYAYTTDFAADLGFTGIAVALVGRNHPVGMAFGALLFGFMERSAQVLDLNGIPKEIVQIMEGVIVLSVVVAYEVVRRIRITQAQRAISRQVAAGHGLAADVEATA